MCGISGIFHFDEGHPVERDALERINTTLSHRGPDRGGIWLAGNIGLGHRRLSIIDLSRSADQPMQNEDGSLVLVFNGEIYNFQSLRNDLIQRGHAFRSNSDSEVILHLYEEAGVDCLKFLRGMFAFALWDNRKRQLFLVRDRLGKKPLKYYTDSNKLIFASELKAILSDPDIPREEDPLAIHYYLTLGYCPAERTGFQHIKKLLPAHYMLISHEGIRVERYWQLDYSRKSERPEQEWCEELQERLRESVRLRLISDVPLGVFLSGGIDSSAVAAFAATALDQPLKTFSIGFSYEKYNELPYARLVANKYQTDHHELIVEPNAMEVFPKLVQAYEEPYSDSSALPTWYLAQYAREQVIVTLNGDGGDENFAGYERYSLFQHYDKIARLLSPLGMGKVLQTLSLLAGRSALSNRLLAASQMLQPDPAARYMKLVSLLDTHKRQVFYTDDFLKQWNEYDPVEVYHSWFHAPQAGCGTTERAQYADIHTYLPGDLLPKVDIATMAHSLESRSPLLDHEFMEFTSTIPMDFKIRQGNKKYIFKQAVREFLPAELLTRPKKGFGIPIHEWFRGELREFAADHLLSKSATARGTFRTAEIESLLQRHNQGENLGYYIWMFLSLEEWRRRYMDRR
jgi:asparagine synthase (glutamine-hydrolysing)